VLEELAEVALDRKRVPGLRAVRGLWADQWISFGTGVIWWTNERGKR